MVNHPIRHPSNLQPFLNGFEDAPFRDLIWPRNLWWLQGTLFTSASNQVQPYHQSMQQSPSSHLLGPALLSQHWTNVLITILVSSVSYSAAKSQSFYTSVDAGASATRSTRYKKRRYGAYKPQHEEPTIETSTTSGWKHIIPPYHAHVTASSRPFVNH